MAIMRHDMERFFQWLGDPLGFTPHKRVRDSVEISRGNPREVFQIRA